MEGTSFNFTPSISIKFFVEPKFECLETSFEDGVYIIRLNRPKKLNSITPTMYSEIGKAFEYAAKNDAIKVAVSTCLISVVMNLVGNHRKW